MLLVGRLRRFVQRHFGKFAVGILAIPVFMRITGFAAKRYLTYQSMKTHDLLRRYKKQRMFEMMEENFESNFRKWYDLMKETIKQTLDAEKHMELLKSGTGSKLENWTEMKIIAFSNILAIVYGSSLLTVLLRIQLNVISGLLFKQMEECPPGLEDLGGAGDASIAASGQVITEDIQQEYMVLTRYLCTDGVKALCELMRNKSRHIIENLSLKEKLSVVDIERLLVDVRSKELKYAPMRVGSDSDSDKEVLNDWCPITEAWYFMLSIKLTKKYLYPPTYESVRSETDRDQLMKTLMGETFDLVKSQDAKNLFKFLESQGLNHYLDLISDFLSTLPPDSDTSQEYEPGPFSDSESTSTFSEVAAPVAKLIPVMNSFINIPFTEDTWAALLLNNESLKSYSANIYESFSAKELDY